ncbi:MAG TPA: NDP-sugar synthase [Candidatus Binataceae bacterium]|nr:NDP-sugar synthase [Candidatus Binataceae bacterium]
MKALVLAAGLGERVRPLTEKIPKPMLPVGGHPLIHYPLAMLKRAGITQVAINVHHLAGQIQHGLRDGKSFGMEITYAPEPTLTGTGGPLNGLRGYFGDETFVLANSDSILDLDLAAMIAFHRDRGAIATVGLFKPDDGHEHEHIEIDRDARIRRMRLLKTRAPLAYNDYPADLGDLDPSSLDWFMYPGIIVMEPAIFVLIPKTLPWPLFTGLFGPMVANRLPVFGYVHRGFFRTVDDLKTYEAICGEFDASPPQFQHLSLS